MELIRIESKNAMTVFTEQGGLAPFIKKIKEEVESFIPDIETNKGRKAIASLAAGVGKSKVYLDNTGKELVSDWKAKAKLVDNSRKAMREELDALKIVARQPLTDWEEEERVRLEKVAAELKREDDWSDALKEDELFDLRKEKAEREAAAKKEQEAEAEKERLRLAEVEKNENEQRIAKQASEEAERKKEEAEEKTRKAEQNKINAEKRLEETKKQAETDRLQAIEDKMRAEIKAKKDKELATENARLAEIKRQDDEKERQLIEQEKLENNRKHVGKIRREAKESLMLFCKIDEEAAKKIVLAIAKGSIKNVNINY